MKRYYLRYDETIDINYIYLLYFYNIAEYDINCNQYNIIHYKSISEIAKKINFIFGKDNINVISESTINRIFKDDNYKDYLTIDKQKKQIKINNNMRDSKKFIVLNEKQCYFILANRDNLLAKYILYLIYYCGFSKTKYTDFTAKQFLSATGYSTTANSYISKISEYNALLVKNNIITILKYRDSLGNERNIYRIV